MTDGASRRRQRSGWRSHLSTIQAGPFWSPTPARSRHGQPPATPAGPHSSWRSSSSHSPRTKRLIPVVYW